MDQQKCEQCKEMVISRAGKRHKGLERTELSREVGHHGNRDDEYEYTCRTCGARFIGDSCGTWEKDDE